MFLSSINPVIVRIVGPVTQEATVGEFLLQTVWLIVALVVATVVLGALFGGLFVLFRKFRPQEWHTAKIDGLDLRSSSR